VILPALHIKLKNPLQNLISRRRGTVLTMADTIANQMESVKLRHILTPFLTSQAILTIKK
jgi:hypothetical protein